jgi:hypothetical protein
MVALGWLSVNHSSIWDCVIAIFPVLVGALGLLLMFAKGSESG